MLTDYHGEIEQWHNMTVHQIQTLARMSVLKLAQRVVEATPVDTGFLKGSWQPTIGAPYYSQADGRAPESAISVTAMSINLGDMFYLTNNAKYAMRLEFGFVGQDSLGRQYDQPGRFFVTDNVHQWPQIVAETVVELGVR